VAGLESRGRYRTEVVTPWELNLAEERPLIVPGGSRLLSRPEERLDEVHEVIDGKDTSHVYFLARQHAVEMW
jgi:hypothetical protein